MAKVMTKSQVVAHLAEKTGIQKKAAAGVLEELVALATKEAKASGQFVVPGLGKAVKANRKARVGRNPQTGEPIKIKAETGTKFYLPRRRRTLSLWKSRELSQTSATKGLAEAAGLVPA